jgi:CubicO group peptidase (beta-lactamase class C family)
MIKPFLPALLSLGSLLISPLAHANRQDDLQKFLFSEAAQGIHTDAIIVVQNGQTLIESYGRGHSPTTRHLSWSMAKTFTGILIGQAADENRLALTDPLTKYFPDTLTSANVQNILNMSSGLHFKEEYAGIPVNSDATLMLYLLGPRVGFANYTATRPARVGVNPGEHYYYSSGDANLLMSILRKSIHSEAEYLDYPWVKLFRPLGIENVTFEQDTKGDFVGSSYIYMTARDYLKVGEMLMNKGLARDGTRVIPEAYFKGMTEIAPGVQFPTLPGASPERAYSNQITTNLAITGRNLLPQYPDLPEDSLIMIGHQGQLIIASPSQKLLIVRLAMDRKDNFDRQAFLAKVYALLTETNHSVSVARDTRADSYLNYVRPVEAVEDGKASFSDYLKVPHLIRALAAKEMCSCLKVEKRSFEDCKSDMATMLPVVPRFNVSEDLVSARLGVGFKASQARFISEKLGCTLVVSK